MGTISVGVCGWDYDAWSGTFYPAELPRSQRLAYLAERFDTVEVNGSFYSLLTPKRYRGWYDATPARFVMALKGRRFITHTKRLRAFVAMLPKDTMSAAALARRPDDRVSDRSPPRRKQRDVYVSFDNDAGGHAPRNAASLRRLVAAGCRAENG